jgi:hypothetical protein
VDWMMSCVSYTRCVLVWAGRGIRGKRNSDVHDTSLFIKCKVVGDFKVICGFVYWYGIML